MTIGVLLVLAGAFALYATAVTSVVTVVYIGTLLLMVGVLEIVSAFKLRRAGPVLPYLLAGLLALVVGGMFLFRPLAGAASVTLLIASYLFASGLFRGISSIIDRYPRWGWDFVYALLAFGLGVYVLAAWPLSSLWVLGTIVAVEIIGRGATLIAASWVLRDIEHGHPIAA
jgi:uncharacterized membrane protein HdeD (DUF308 family)